MIKAARLGGLHSSARLSNCTHLSTPHGASSVLLLLFLGPFQLLLGHEHCWWFFRGALPRPVWTASLVAYKLEMAGLLQGTKDLRVQRAVCSAQHLRPLCTVSSGQTSAITVLTVYLACCHLSWGRCCCHLRSPGLQSPVRCSGAQLPPTPPTAQQSRWRRTTAACSHRDWPGRSTHWRARCLCSAPAAAEAKQQQHLFSSRGPVLHSEQCTPTLTARMRAPALPLRPQHPIALLSVHQGPTWTGQCPLSHLQSVCYTSKYATAKTRPASQREPAQSARHWSSRYSGQAGAQNCDGPKSLAPPCFSGSIQQLGHLSDFQGPPVIWYADSTLLHTRSSGLCAPDCDAAHDSTFDRLPKNRLCHKARLAASNLPGHSSVPAWSPTHPSVPTRRQTSRAHRPQDPLTRTASQQ